MVLFIKDENKLKDLWKTGIVTKVIRSKTDQIPRTIQLKTATSKKIVRPVQKLSIPEWEIVQEEDDQPTSHFLQIKDIAVPELTNASDLKNYLGLKP